jgi:hypothetical protein
MPNRCWTAGGARTAGARHRRYAAADNSTRGSSHEESVLLFAVNRIIGVVQIEHDLFRRFGGCLKQEINQKVVTRWLKTPVALPEQALNAPQSQ